MGNTTALGRDTASSYVRRTATPISRNLGPPSLYLCQGAPTRCRSISPSHPSGAARVENSSAANSGTGLFIMATLLGVPAPHLNLSWSLFAIITSSSRANET